MTIDSSRLLHFKLNESAGTTVTDSSGDGNTGTLANFTNVPNCWVGTGSEGKRSLSGPGGLDFGQGADDTCTFAFEDPGDETSMMFFLRWDGTSTYPRIIHLGRGDSTPHHYIYVNHVYTKVEMSIPFSGGPQYFGPKPGTTTADGKWHHYAFTYDASNYANNAIVYIDGSPVEIDDSHSSGDRTNLADALRDYGAAVGNVTPSGGNNRGLDGVLSDVRIYNRILTANEIDQIANFRSYETAEALDLKADFTIDRYKQLSRQYSIRGGMDNSGSLQAPFSTGARGGANIRNRSKVYQVKKG